MEWIDVLEAKSIYEKGENVTNYLREKYGSEDNSSAIIELAYDLQAGSYIENVKSNFDKHDSYASELSKVLDENLRRGDSVLDVGTGELTTLTLVLNKLETELSRIAALDLSWSRLAVGMKFHQNYRKLGFSLDVFAADMKNIPLHGKCVDVAISSHALEANGGNLETALLELFRVAKKKLILFEPSYELNSEEGQARMDSLGYIKNIEGTVTKLGGKVIDVTPIRHDFNPLNPTTCYIIEPPAHTEKNLEMVTFCVPGTNFKLESDGRHWFSKDTGLVFPVLDDISIFKMSSAILATLKC